MKHYWWVVPLIALSMLLGFMLSILENIIAWLFIVASIGLLVDSVEKGTKDEILGVDWPESN